MPQAARTGRQAAAIRADRLVAERVHDPYRLKRKPREPIICPGCGATFHAGRWQSAKAPASGRKSFCPACRRMRDGYPAGTVIVQGEFAAGHQDEILHVLRNVEEREKSRHPLNRIMTIGRKRDGLVVDTTDMHLARRMGEALRRAYHGALVFEYAEESGMLRVRWQR